MTAPTAVSRARGRPCRSPTCPPMHARAREQSSLVQESNGLVSCPCRNEDLELDENAVGCPQKAAPRPWRLDAELSHQHRDCSPCPARAVRHEITRDTHLHGSLHPGNCQQYIRL